MPELAFKDPSQSLVKPSTLWTVGGGMMGTTVALALALKGHYRSIPALLKNTKELKRVGTIAAPGASIGAATGYLGLKGTNNYIANSVGAHPYGYEAEDMTSLMMPSGIGDAISRVIHRPNMKTMSRRIEDFLMKSDKPTLDRMTRYLTDRQQALLEARRTGKSLSPEDNEALDQTLDRYKGTTLARSELLARGLGVWNPSEGSLYERQPSGRYRFGAPGAMRSFIPEDRYKNYVQNAERDFSDVEGGADSSGRLLRWLQHKNPASKTYDSGTYFKNTKDNATGLMSFVGDRNTLSAANFKGDKLKDLSGQRRGDVEIGDDPVNATADAYINPDNRSFTMRDLWDLNLDKGETVFDRENWKGNIARTAVSKGLMEEPVTTEEEYVYKPTLLQRMRDLASGLLPKA